MNATLTKLPGLNRPAAPTERELLQKKYDDYTEELYAAQTDEDIMESRPAGTQRIITLDALHQVKVYYPDLQIFNELPVLYPRPGSARLNSVAPDNMVCLFAGEIGQVASFSIELQEAKPFVMFEYVSRGLTREKKDYVANRKKYEQDLKVPYYLLFHPVKKRLDLWYLNTRKVYSPVKRNGEGRLAIPELELEVAVHEGWARYWFRGELLLMMGEIRKSLDVANREVEAAKKDVETAKKDVETAKKDVETAQARASDSEMKVALEREARRLAEEKNAKLLERLRQLGMDDD